MRKRQILELKRKSSGARSDIKYFTVSERGAAMVIKGGAWSDGYVWSVEQ